MFYESFIMMVKVNSHSNNHTLAEHPISRGRGAGFRAQMSHVWLSDCKLPLNRKDEKFVVSL